MDASGKYDVAIIGGGIVGLASAMVLSQIPNMKIVVIEAEQHIARHQTGNNSGVIHSGLYYKPGSLKAKNCVTGRKAMYEFCQRHEIPHEKCGKVVVAASEKELAILDDMEKRGLANGLTGLKKLNREELREYEPHVEGIAGLLVPETGIVDYVDVCEAFARVIREAGNDIITNARFTELGRYSGELIIKTTSGDVRAINLINCGGLQSDRIAKICGINPGLMIVPFRGEYYKLNSEKHHLVNNLIYPVPDPSFPFLGVHFTRMIHGGIEAGPNAVLSFKREGYQKTSFSLKDTIDTFTYPGFIRLAARYMKTGLGEFYRSFYKHAFVKALQKLIPEITESDISPGGAGVRAQALTPDGSLVDDFRIVEAENMIHVLNAPSPAATASISIGKIIAEMAEKNFSLKN
ncbi:MAG: L-2-hydroxyglutarate oxidase [Calditrichaceae bacterium]